MPTSSGFTQGPPLVWPPRVCRVGELGPKALGDERKDVLSGRTAGPGNAGLDGIFRRFSAACTNGVDYDEAA